MTEELITPQNVTTELLVSTLDAAFMDAAIDKDGNLMVREDIRCRIIINEQKDILHFYSFFGFVPNTSRQERLECVNRINSEYIIAKAYASDDNTLIFQHDMMIVGGSTKKAFILALKRFCSIPRMAISQHGGNLVE